MEIVGVPVIDCDPVEPGPEIAFHLSDEVAGEGLEIGHLGSILRRNDEAEVMPIVMSAPREICGFGPDFRGAEHMGLLAVTGRAITLKVGNVGGERRGTEGTTPMADHTGLHDDAAMTRKQPAAAERSAASPER